MITTLLAAALAFTSPSGRACYRIGGSSAAWYPVNDHTIMVSQGVHAYRITTNPSPILLQGPTFNVRYSSAGVVCSPLDVDIGLSSSSGHTRLIVQSIQPLSPVAAESLRHGGPSYRHPGA